MSSPTPTLDDRLRDALAAHRPSSPPPDGRWRAVRTDARSRQRRQRATRIGIVAAAAVLLVVAVVTVRIVRADHDAPAPAVDVGPADTSHLSKDDLREHARAGLDVDHQLERELVMTVAATADPTLVTSAQLAAQRTDTDRAMDAWLRAIGRAPVPTSGTLPAGSADLLAVARRTVDQGQAPLTSAVDGFRVLIDGTESSLDEWARDTSDPTAVTSLQQAASAGRMLDATAELVVRIALQDPSNSPGPLRHASDKDLQDRATDLAIAEKSFNDVSPPADKQLFRDVLVDGRFDEAVTRALQAQMPEATELSPTTSDVYAPGLARLDALHELGRRVLI